MMNMWAVAGLASSGTRRAVASIFLQRVHQAGRRAGNRGAAGVGGELARPRDRGLDQHRGERREDDRREQGDGVRAAVVAVARAAEEHRKPRDHHDRRGDRRGNRADQDVAMLDVRELVGDDAFQLLLVEDPHDAFGRGDRRVVRVAAGRKGVGRVLRNDVDPRHRQAAALREVGGDPVERMAGADLFRAVHREDDLVREPVRPEVHDGGQNEAEHQALRAAERLADQQEQPAERAEQKGRLQSVRHTCILAPPMKTPGAPL